jgi:hypothetical protein
MTLKKIQITLRRNDWMPGPDEAITVAIGIEKCLQYFILGVAAGSLNVPIVSNKGSKISGEGGKNKNTWILIASNCS